MAERIFINADAFKSKVQMVSKMDGLTITNYLSTLGVPHSVMANCRNYYIDYCANKGLNKNEIKRVDSHIGYIPENHFNRIIEDMKTSGRPFLVSEADVDEMIQKIIDERVEQNVAQPGTEVSSSAVMIDNAQILAKLDEVINAINKLGNIGMQNMETLNAIRKNWE